MAIEIVNCRIKNKVMFHSYVNGYQRVIFTIIPRNLNHQPKPPAIRMVAKSKSPVENGSKHPTI